jgi:hypothetical protein
MVKSIINLTTTLAVALGLSVALITAPVSAGSTGNKQGPQASIDVATRCMLDINGTLTVNVIVQDKGSVDAVVSAIEIVPVYKGETKGNNTDPYYTDEDGNPISGGCTGDVTVGSGYTCTDTFNLCDNIPQKLRAINTDVTIKYGTSDKPDGKTVSNHCTDDPDTFPDFEGGININYEELTAACD